MDNPTVGHSGNGDDVYRYTECGLDNVIIKGVAFVTDDQGEQVLHIPAINCLHKTIALGIVVSQRRMSGNELRFLRTELGLTQDELGQFVQRDVRTVARWEGDETPIQKAPEVCVRALAVRGLQLDITLRGIVEVMSKRRRGSADEKILIDGSKKNDYTLVA